MGRRLRPFCLWHQLVLQVIESPLIDGQGTVTDLDLAAGICCTRYGQPLDLKPRHPLLAALKMRWRGFTAERAEWQEYVDDYVQLPEYKLLEGSIAPPTTIGQPPHLLALAAKVMAKFHIAERATWEMGLGQLYWYSAMADKLDGAKMDFKTPQKNQFLEDLKAKYGHRT